MIPKRLRVKLIAIVLIASMIPGMVINTFGLEYEEPPDDPDEIVLIEEEDGDPGGPDGIATLTSLAFAEPAFMALSDEQMNVSLRWTSPGVTTDWNPANTLRVIREPIAIDGEKYPEFAHLVGDNNVYPDTRLIYTPELNERRYVTYQLVFSQPQDDADRTAKPGELEARIPRYIFNTRDGGYVVNTIAAPHLDKPTPAQDNSDAEHSLDGWRPVLGTVAVPIGLQARVDLETQEIVIWNVVDFEVSKRATMDVTYHFIPGNVQNGFSRTMEAGNAIVATASYFPKLKDDNGNLIDANGNRILYDTTGDGGYYLADGNGLRIPGEAVPVPIDGGFTTKSNPLELQINTFVRQPYLYRSGVSTVTSEAKYEFWQPGWMPLANSSVWQDQGWGGTAQQREVWRSDPSSWPRDSEGNATHLEPFDPSEYFYIIYRMRYHANDYYSTQPYDLTFSFDLDLIERQGGEVLGIIGNNKGTGDPAHAFTNFMVQTASQISDARMTVHFPSSTVNAHYSFNRNILVRYKRDVATPGSRLFFETKMYVTGIDNPGDASVWGPNNLTVRPPHNVNTTTTGYNTDHNNHNLIDQYWDPRDGLNNQPKYTHERVQRSSYLYTGVHFVYGGGNYSTYKYNEWARDYRGTLSRMFSGINRLEDGHHVEPRRYPSGTFNYNFYITGAARGWHLTRVSGLISIPIDINWYTEFEGWDYNEIIEGRPPGHVVNLSGFRVAVYCGMTQDTAFSSRPVYWEIFQLNGEEAVPLGFKRLTETEDIQTASETIDVPHERAARSGDGGYYRRNYSVELQDSMMFLAPSAIGDNSVNTAITGAGNFIRLQPEDYSITSTYLIYTEYVHTQNPNLGTISEVAATDYNNYAPVTVEYKRASMGDVWITAGNVLRNGGNYTYTPIFSGAPQLQTPSGYLTATNQIVLPSDTYEVRYLHTNNRYQVNITSYFKMRLHPTEHVLGIINEIEAATLVNVSSFIVRDDQGVIQNTRNHNQIWSGTSDGNSTPAETLRRQILQHDNQRFGTIYTDYATTPSTDTSVMHYSSQIFLLRMPTASVLNKSAGEMQDFPNDPVYELDEDGYLILVDGNPVPVYMTDNNGDLILDPGGNPVQLIRMVKTNLQQLDMYESIQYDPSDVVGVNASHAERVASLESDGLFNRQMSGTFYDLLPAGTTIENLEVRTYYFSVDNTPANRDSRWDNGRVLSRDNVKIQTVPNWQNSGRTMLIVNVKAPENQAFYDTAANALRGPNYHIVRGDNFDTAYTGFMMRFTLVTTYENIYDKLAGGAGFNSYNMAAYRAAPGGRLSKGLTVPTVSPWNAMINGNQVRTYFESLQSAPGSPDDGNRNTVYGSVSVGFTAPGISVDGIYKNVRSEKDATFGVRTETIPGGKYTYQLRYQGPRNAGEFSRFVILYDIFETRGNWKGTIESVDVVDARVKGIDVKVYYSTIVGLEPVNITGTGSRRAESYLDAMKLADGTIVSPTLETGGEVDYSGCEPVWIPVTLTNNNFWTVPPELQDIVTAVAIDLSRRTTNDTTTVYRDGWDFSFRLGDSAACLVNMRAPTRNNDKIEDIISGNLEAINQTSYSKVMMDDRGGYNPSARVSNVTRLTIREVEFGIAKSSSPESGSDVNPRPVNNGDIMEYTVSIQNLDVFPVRGVKALDVIPAGIEILNEGANRIRYYFGSDPSTAVVLPTAPTGSSPTYSSVIQDGQQLSFFFSEIGASQTANIIIPVKVSIEGSPFTNQASVLEINDGDYLIESNITHHQVFPKINLESTKTLGGRTLRMLPNGQGEFRFTVTETTSWKPLEQRQTVSASHDINGDIVFGDLFFTAVGVHTFEVTEVKGALAGITYDETKYIVTVNVKSDGMGGLVYDPAVITVDGDVKTGIVFNNVFTPPDISLTLITPTAQTSPLAPILSRKTMVNKALMHGEFEFEIKDKATGLLVVSGINRDNGFLDFSPITYTVADAGKTFTYIVTEKIPEQALDNDTMPLTHNWITYDDTSYELEVKVVIADPATGLLSTVVNVTGKTVAGIPVAGEPFGPITFSNRYTTPPVTFSSLQGTKTLVGGRYLTLGEFGFELEWVSTTSESGRVVLPDEAGRSVRNGITNNTSGSFTFGSMQFWEEDIGQHIYRVREIVPGNADLNIAYDVRVYTVAVNVIKNQYSGALEATHRVTAIDGEDVIGNVAIAFTNVFTPEPILKTDLTATKLFPGGRALKQGEFTFSVNDITDLTNVKPAGTGTNDVNGSITFSGIRFDHVGTYRFSIREVIPPASQRDMMVTYDPTEYTMAITVVANSSTGVLSFSGNPVFRRVNADGTETVINAADFRFNNAFTPMQVSLSLSGDKELTGGRTLRNEEFSFEVKDSGNNVVSTGKNNAAGSISFTPISFSAAGDYTFTISEAIPAVGSRDDYVTYDPTVYTAAVRISQDPGNGELFVGTPLVTGGAGDGNIKFTNVFLPDVVSVPITGTKSLVGGKNMAEDDFEFIVTDVTDPLNPVVVRRSKNQEAEVDYGTVTATGGFSFAPLEYTRAGVYSYIVSEVIPPVGSIDRVARVTYDDTAYQVTVTIDQDAATGIIWVASTDVTGGDGSGSISFTNIFTPDEIIASIPLGSKTLAGGRVLQNGEFAFTLTEVGAPVEKLTEPIVARNNAAGVVSFGTLTFEGADIGTHSYVIEEVLPAEVLMDPNVIYDIRQYTLDITVGIDNETGELTLSEWSLTGGDEIAFNNIYAPDPFNVTLEGTKILQGRDKVAGEFSFAVWDSADVLAAEGSSRDDGAIAFSTILYSEADIGKTFRYTVAETSVDALMGVTYDTTVFNVSVTLAQNPLTGIVTPVIDIDGGEIVFTNSYISPYLEITKEDSLGEKMPGVTFRLERTTGIEWEYMGEYTTDGNGVARLVPLIPYEEYRVTEVTLRGYYQPEPYEFYVTGDDFMDPGFVAITWINYRAEGCVTVAVESTASGSIPLSGVLFGIYAADDPDVLIAEATSDEFGKVTFEGLPLKLSAPVTYNTPPVYENDGLREYFIVERNMISGYLPIADAITVSLSLGESAADEIIVKKAPRPAPPPPSGGGSGGTGGTTPPVAPPPVTTTETDETNGPPDTQNPGSAPGGSGSGEQPAPGGRNHDAVPVPHIPGNQMVAGPDGIYVELDERGTPLGAWSWDPDEGMWIFDGDTALAEWAISHGLPKTGYDGVNPNLYMLGLLYSLALFAYSLYKRRRV